MAEPDLKQLFRDVLTEMAGEGGDLGTMEDTLPALTAALEQFASSDFACAMRGLPPTPPVVYRGVEGVAEAWRDYGDAFDTVRAVLDEIVEAEDHLLVMVDQVAVTKHGGVEMHQPSAMLFRFDGAQVAGVEFHLDRAEALRAAGIEP